MSTDYVEIIRRAESYRAPMSRFLRDLIARPSPSGQEEAVIRRIREEMESCGFERIEVDAMGNIRGYLGRGGTLLAMDAHIDTVGIGDPEQWEHDPFKGHEDPQRIFGRGASDQKGGMAALVYAGRIIRDLELEDDYTLVVTGTVQEEDCEGLCWEHLIEEVGLRPEFVVSTEPTAGNVYRGQRGRMEIRITTRGISCHGSAPERGENAIFKMAPILRELEDLHGRLADHDFLGKGSLTVSEIFFSSPSRCAVADGCTISIDRRLTWGETAATALQEIRELPAVKRLQAEVEVYKYSKPSYTGLTRSTRACFPAWLIPEDHTVTQCLVQSYRHLFGAEPQVDKWTFSTNGVTIMGKYGIPCIGFGPGHEDQAHAANEHTWKDELVRAAAMYALIPREYMRIKRGNKPHE